MIRDLAIFGVATFGLVVFALAVIGIQVLVRSQRARRRGDTVMHLPQAQVPGCIHESARCVLNAHGMWIVDKRGELLTDERMEQLLRELGRNATAGLYSVDLNEENF